MIVVAGFIPASMSALRAKAGINPATTLVCADLKIIADSVTRIYNLFQPANSRCDTVSNAGIQNQMVCAQRTTVGAASRRDLHALTTFLGYP